MRLLATAQRGNPGRTKASQDRHDPRGGRTMKAHEIAQHLQKPARCGNGWSAHKDTKPSLTLTDSPTGKVLVCCHSGCSQEAVIEALKALGLWEPELQQKRVVVAEYNYHSA